MGIVIVDSDLKEESAQLLLQPGVISTAISTVPISRTQRHLKRERDVAKRPDLMD